MIMLKKTPFSAAGRRHVMNREMLMNDRWEFLETKIGTAPDAVMAMDGWQQVDLPHDWLIYTPKDLYRTGEGWYRRVIQSEKREGERALIRFEGVYQDCTVFMNGSVAGEWKYGYSTFEIDLTDLIRDGENELLVRCVYQSPNSRWYSGAGIYRNVWLKYVPAAHFASDGIYITPVKEGDVWRVEIDAELVSDGPVDAVIAHRIIGPHGEEAGRAAGRVACPGTDSRTVTVAEPLLWDIENPHLYTLESTLTAGNDTHTVRQRFGFRETKFDPDHGFFLNGRHVKLHGVCMHHDLGALGAAVNRAAAKRQLTVMRGMGVNALRTSHNMPSVEMMDLCDEMGFLVDSEAFDMWERPKTAYDYARFFPDWAEKDVAAWVRRDRNRPSVIMWSIGNEIYDTHASDRGQEVTRMLQSFVRASDPKGHAPCTIGSNYMPWEGAQKCADILKVAGYNYAERHYDAHHAAHPDWVIYGSETFSIVQSRGIYHFPYSEAILSDDDLQCSALGNSRTSWGAYSYEKCIAGDRDAAFCMGQFIWTGFDYIGEPTPYHTKNSYFGTVDTAGFPKDAYYVFKGEWTDYKKAPFVHIFPYWDFNEGQLIDVQVASNAPKIRLYLNDELIGEKAIDHMHGQDLTGKWQVPYVPGVLYAEALDEKGRILAADERRSFGEAAALRLSAEKTALDANGIDLAFVEITAADEKGNPVENAGCRVRVTVEGPGRLVGLDNGDSTDYDSWKGNSRRLFSGKLLAIIAATEEAGEIVVRAESEGLAGAELPLTAREAEKIPGVSCTARNTICPENEEIPIRRVELILPEGRRFTKAHPETRVQVRLHPENATYHDLSWRVTTAGGIDSNLAAVTPTEDGAVVRALGDGRFYLRCTAANGAEHPRIISQIECDVTGMGPALLDPYSFVAGGLYSLSDGRIGTGNERGLCTAAEEDSMAGFQRLDFGPVGSDEITIPFFTLNDEAHPFELYVGDPREGGEKVLDGIYQKPSVWNTYQAETYRLTRRLTGVCDLWIVGHLKMHMKGFQFTRYERAYEPIRAVDCDLLYGDQFEKRADAVYGIGNNVSVGFENMRFGENDGVTLHLTGRTGLDKNTINIRFSGKEEEVTYLAEFTRSEDWVEQTFRLPRVPENCTVLFVFLPGCQFDFREFRFEK